MKPVFLALLLLLSACTPEKRSEFKGKLRAPDSPKFDEAFWKTWADGQAELSSYDLQRSKYGAGRTGTAVAIFVTETFSNILRVKADPGKHQKQDEIPVMKLNLVEDFQTGVYDYNLMLSTFVNTQTAGGILGGSPIKVSFSSQEWCGHIYKQALFDGPGVRVTSHSYFDGEADQEKTVDPIEDGVAEDGLLLWARGMARPVLKPGESKTVDLFSALETAGQGHRRRSAGRRFRRSGAPHEASGAARRRLPGRHPVRQSGRGGRRHDHLEIDPGPGVLRDARHADAEADDGSGGSGEGCRRDLLRRCGRRHVRHVLRA